MGNIKTWTFCLGLIFSAGASLQAGYLFFSPDASNPATPNGFREPSLDFDGSVYEYSAWDIFYAAHTAGNYPDLFAPYGGHETSLGSGVWVPESRTTANANADVTKPAGGFASSPWYNPSNAVAFWDTRNATLTQTATSAFIVGPDVAGNIYTFSEKTKFVLRNSPDYGSTGIGTVILQFQTDGNQMDFSKIRLVYNNGVSDVSIFGTDAEYLREYQQTGSNHWSAAGGYSNRVALQWDLSGLTDNFGNPIKSYQVYFEALSSSVSLQKVDLVTSDTYKAGIPISATWNGGTGSWMTASNWSIYKNGIDEANEGVNVPMQNGNIKFANNTAATVAVDGGNHTIGELIFQSAQNVTINAVAASKLTSNTGISTTSTATGTYTINPDFVLGAVNFFDIHSGTVVMNGVISGAYGIVKDGAGTLVLKNNNTFGQFLGIQNGTVRVEGANLYSGNTSVLNGKLVVAANAGSTGALGSSTSVISVGADSGVYAYIGGSDWLAELIIDGGRTISRDISLATGDYAKRLGGTATGTGSIFSGSINFSGTSSNPDAPDTAAGNIFLTASAASDKVTFQGAMTGGATSKNVTLDGVGTVTYSGVDKTYNNATVVQSGSLVIASGTTHKGNGAYTVKQGAKLFVNGALSYDTTVAAPVTAVLSLTGGLLGGSGVVNRNTEVGAGGIISPGQDLASHGKLTVGSAANNKNLTWINGGIYQWSVSSLSGAAGTDWDVIEVIGSLAAPQTGTFTIDVNSSGPIAWTENLQNWEWLIATTTTGVANFDASRFVFNVEDFSNTLGAQGVFGLVSRQNNLYLAFSAVPEPSRMLLLFAGLACTFLRRHRKSDLSIKVKF